MMSNFIEEEYDIPDYVAVRDEAIQQARRWLEMDFVVLDTETTGLDDDDVIVSVGVVAKDGQVLFDSLVNPGKPIPAGATAVHGIDDKMVAGAPSFSEILPELDKVLRGKKVLIYNEQYDTRMLTQSAFEAGIMKFEFWWYPPLDWKYLEPFDTGWYCVMEQFARFYGSWNDCYGTFRWQKLSMAAAYFGLDTTGTHGAVADALMTLGVIRGMAAAKLSTEEKDVNND